MKYKCLIVNDETGEIINETGIDTVTVDKDNPKYKICKQIVDKMLDESVKIEDFDEEMLYSWCKITKEINDRGQIRLLGAYRDGDIDTKMLENITITGYTSRIIKIAHNYSCILMKNHKTSIGTWGEIFEAIECNNRTIQQKVKQFIVGNDIIRDIKIKNMKGENEKKFILNPFLFRGANYSSQLSVMLFQDFIKENINMNSYPLRWLQSRGYINKGL
ncbi:MAG: hypothetical protein ACRC7W_02440 [Fusobacteriaceae bacterium]